MEMDESIKHFIRTFKAGDPIAEAEMVISSFPANEKATKAELGVMKHTIRNLEGVAEDNEEALSRLKALKILFKKGQDELYGRDDDEEEDSLIGDDSIKPWQQSLLVSDFPQYLAYTIMYKNMISQAESVSRFFEMGMMRNRGDQDEKESNEEEEEEEEKPKRRTSSRKASSKTESKKPKIATKSGSKGKKKKKNASEDEEED